ncbi:TIGR03086 family protein [Plantactinospora sp. S1510]|uniref:TIGR03086 family protein n=1 Tax=Plantactinospora alkalitolerans TaxID=2789879 RepID=A0ABS0H522_9ACTN|nr:TIGR03086 family metal-binding protein [Plantactinospora alkalitolerans]MBF9133411.1 TIGR03086 family protein [Plantactinospora alkalitolerans]
MSDLQLAGRAATTLVEIIRNIKPDQLDAPTPCAEYDVRKLINHLLFWGPPLEGAGRKETVRPPAAADTEVDLTGGDWAAELEAQVGRTAEAWSQPAAWEGTTRVVGPTELPATMIGGMVVCEMVAHGWDLAQATGQKPDWDDELLAFVHEEVSRTAEQGRQMGAYGPEVSVPASSSTLDRVLGIIGRDPDWRR